MNQYKLISTLQISVVCLLLITISPGVIAKQSTLSGDNPVADSTKQIIKNKQWAQWILSQVQNLPSLQAMAKGTLAAGEQRIAMQQPLYNPELSASYADKTDEEYYVVVSQKIDWFDKRSAREQLGQKDYELVELQKALQTENKLSEALFAYIEFSMAQQLLEIAKKQEILLTQLSSDLKVREDAGDVGHIDAEMAYLSLSQNLQQISLIGIRYRKASTNLEKTLNSHTVSIHPEESVWLNTLAKVDVLRFVEQGIKSQYAQKLLEQSISQSKIAQLNKKANPTIGLGAGRDGDENTVLFELSIPLNIRNNFSSEYSASLHKINQSELELMETQRLLKSDIKQSLNNYQLLKSRVLSWQKLTSNRLINTQSLLNKQWLSGDITTSDHLFSLRQRTDTIIANIELIAEMQKAWVDWLLATSQTQKWLYKL